MKITIVVDRYYPYIGGIEKYVHGLSLQLTSDGHDMTIVTGPGADADAEETAPEGKIIRSQLLEDASPKPQKAVDKAHDIAWLLESTKPDVVYANNHASLGAIRGAKLAGIPVVYGCHGWGLMCPSRIRLLKPTGEICEAETSYRACMKCYASSPAPLKARAPGLVKQAFKTHRYIGYHEILDSADARIGISQLAAGMFREQRNTFAVHPGTDLDVFRPVDSSAFRQRFRIEGDYVLAPGRINPIKGQVDALRAVHETRSDLTLVVAGNATLDPRKKSETGPYGEALKERATALGMSNRLIFTGMLSQFEMAEAYSGASVTVVPSIWAEPFGYVAAESMACGTPVIITKNSGAAELVDDTVGQKVPRQDHVAMARAIERIVPVSEQLGRAARRRVQERVAWPGVAARVLEVLKRVTVAEDVEQRLAA